MRDSDTGDTLINGCMTWRDLAAMKAMQSILAAGAVSSCVILAPSSVARESYEMAEAMLAEKLKGEESRDRS